MRKALAMFGRKPVKEIGAADLRDLASALMTGGIRQCANRLGVARAVLRWASEKGICEMPRFPRVARGGYRRFVPPAPEELDAMLNVALSQIQRVIIIGSQCGLRVGGCELFALKWDDIDLSRKLIRVSGSRKNPDAPWREVPLRESILPLFRQWKEEDENEGMNFLIHYHGKPVRSIKSAWQTVLEQAGLGRKIRPYDLRHAFATELIGAGVDIGTVAKLMGHSSPLMLLNHYEYVMDRQKRAAVEALPELAPFSARG